MYRLYIRSDVLHQLARKIHSGPSRTFGLSRFPGVLERPVPPVSMPPASCTLMFFTAFTSSGLASTAAVSAARCRGVCKRRLLPNCTLVSSACRGGVTGRMRPARDAHQSSMVPYEASGPYPTADLHDRMCYAG